MKECNGFVLVFALFLMTSSSAVAGENTHWGYSGDEGPENWGTLNREFLECSAGKNQAPINIADTIESQLPPIRINYHSGGDEIFNNGHTIQVNYAPGNTIRIDKDEYELKQFHFHAPSENTIDGSSYPMEAHFVHADKLGNLAVVALMFKTGETNRELEKAWAQMPENVGDKWELSKKVNANALLPHDRDYYYFNGSLTTPPCSEGVHWFVMKRYVTASKAQIEKFSKTIHHPNNRPIQPLNARRVMK